MMISEICLCPVVHPATIIHNRCMGSKPKHKTCGGIIESYREKRIVQEDRPDVEYR